MTTTLQTLEKIAREILEKEAEILHCKQEIEDCNLCTRHRLLLNRMELQTRSLLRGIVAYVEKMRNDRREKRKRHKWNLALRKNDNF